MNPRLDFRGHPVEYRHFHTDRFSGLMPHHFEHKRRSTGVVLLLAATVGLGIGALAVFVIQVLR